jgi:hypothetical protein
MQGRSVVVRAIFTLNISMESSMFRALISDARVAGSDPNPANYFISCPLHLLQLTTYELAGRVIPGQN